MFWCGAAICGQPESFPLAIRSSLCSLAGGAGYDCWVSLVCYGVTVKEGCARIGKGRMGKEGSERLGNYMEQKGREEWIGKVREDKGGREKKDG